jgi:hypothetical protein
LGSAETTGWPGRETRRAPASRSPPRLTTICSKSSTAKVIVPYRRTGEAVKTNAVGILHRKKYRPPKTRFLASLAGRISPWGEALSASCHGKPSLPGLNWGRWFRTLGGPFACSLHRRRHPRNFRQISSVARWYSQETAAGWTSIVPSTHTGDRPLRRTLFLCEFQDADPSNAAGSPESLQSYS